MWTPEHRLAARRVSQRYDSDLTNEEWALVDPLIPPPKRGGGKRTVNIREVLNGILYVLWTGCQWKALPKDFPPAHRAAPIRRAPQAVDRGADAGMDQPKPSSGPRL